MPAHKILVEEHKTILSPGESWRQGYLSIFVVLPKFRYEELGIVHG